MKKDISFPNPLERPELSSSRRKWKYIALAAAVIVASLTIFLPNILSSKIGRNLIKMRLESKYRGTAWVTAWNTRWFGPTSVEKFSLTDGQGRQIKFQQLNSPLGLWHLLFGTFDLKDATITGLHVEYVIDHGDGTSTLDRLPQDAALPSVVGYPRAIQQQAPIQLPAISGHITLKDATLILTRGHILQREQLKTIYRSLHLTHINGTLDIKQLDQPWQCDVAGMVGSDPSPGRFQLSGVFDLGENGKFDLAKGSAEVKLSMQDVPNSAGPGAAPLAWLFFPNFSAEDNATMLGPSLRRVDAICKLTNGKLQFQQLDTERQLTDGRINTVSLRPIIDLTSTPAMISLDGELVAAVHLSTGVAQRLAHVNPFLSSAADGQGLVDLKFDKLTMPLNGDPRKISLMGKAAIHNAAVMSGSVPQGDTLPQELVTQWQAAIGNTKPMLKLDTSEIRFAVQNGVVSCEPYQMTLDGIPLTLSGTARLDGSLSMQSEITLPGVTAQAIKTGIRGTTAKPTLDIPLGSPLAEAISRNIEELRARKAERLFRLSEMQVRDMLQMFDRMGQNQPRPATQKQDTPKQPPPPGQ